MIDLRRIKLYVFIYSAKTSIPLGVFTEGPEELDVVLASFD